MPVTLMPSTKVRWARKKMMIAGAIPRPGRGFRKGLGRLAAAISFAA